MIDKYIKPIFNGLADALRWSAVKIEGLTGRGGPGGVGK